MTTNDEYRQLSAQHAKLRTELREMRDDLVEQQDETRRNFRTIISKLDQLAKMISDSTKRSDLKREVRSSHPSPLTIEDLLKRDAESG